MSSSLLRSLLTPLRLAARPAASRAAPRRAWLRRLAWPAASLLIAGAAQAQGVLSIYSARHYPTDEALYEGFTQASGIRIQRVDADDAGILARLRTEGQASPADVVLLVDAARL